MAFHIDANVLPRIHGYNHARDLFNSITPIRGGDQSVRRIGKRNDATKWLKHEIRDGVDVFIAGFHYSNIIEYYPTHYNLSMCGWNTLSTQLFIHAITGNRCCAVRTSDYIPRGFSVEINGGAIYDHYAMHASKRYTFDYADKPLQTMPVLNKYKVNRKRMNEVRKIAKPFLQYMHTMFELSPEQIDPNDIVAWRGHLNIMECMEDEAKWWELFQYLSWHSRTSIWNGGNIGFKRVLRNMVLSIDNELKGRNPQVLDVV